MREIREDLPTTPEESQLMDEMEELHARLYKNFSMGDLEQMKKNVDRALTHVNKMKRINSTDVEVRNEVKDLAMMMEDMEREVEILTTMFGYVNNFIDKWYE